MTWGFGRFGRAVLSSLHCKFWHAFLDYRAGLEDAMAGRLVEDGNWDW